MAAPQNLLPVYQTLDRPLKSILNEIHENRWVLPAIQREFVWSDEQICRLFDSMMRGIPVRNVFVLANRRANRFEV